MVQNIFKDCIFIYLRVRVILNNATFNNISVISWQKKKQSRIIGSDPGFVLSSSFTNKHMASNADNLKTVVLLPTRVCVDKAYETVIHIQ